MRDLSTRAARWLAARERRPPTVGTSTARAALEHLGVGPLDEVLAFHDRYAGLVERVDRQVFVLGVACHDPALSAPTRDHDRHLHG